MAIYVWACAIANLLILISLGVYFYYQHKLLLYYERELRDNGVSQVSQAIDGLIDNWKQHMTSLSMHVIQYRGGPNNNQVYVAEIISPSEETALNVVRGHMALDDSNIISISSIPVQRAKISTLGSLN